MAKKDDVKDIAGKIIVDVERVAERTMYLTQYFGNGTLGKTKFSASFTLPAMSLIVTVGDKRYMIASQDLITEIVKLNDQK